MIIQVTKRLNAHCRLTIASAMTLCTLLYGGCVPPLYAASNLVNPASYDEVARAEQVFFGKPDTTNTFLRRLDLLEIGIFGRVRSGSAEKRFDRIANALGLGEGYVPSTRPPGDLTKGLANHESRENGATPASSLNTVSEPGGSTIPDYSRATGGNETGDSSALAAGRPGDDVSASADNIGSAQSASKSNLAENSHAQKTTPKSAKKTTTSDLKATTAAGMKSTLKSDKAPLLSKETPQFESKVASVAPIKADDANHRIKRPAPGVLNDIAHDKAKEVEELFKKGMSEFRDKRFSEAQVCFKKILFIDPRNVDAYYNLGSISETKRDYVDALTYYRAALATKPADTEFKTAVRSMEDELHKQHTRTANSNDRHSANSTVAAEGSKNGGSKNNSAKNNPAGNSGHGSGTSDRYTPEVTVGSQQAPIANVGSQQAPISDVGSQQAPIIDLSSVDAPVVPAQQIGDKAFSLQTAQNGMTTPFTPMNAIPAPYQGVPVYGVPQTLGGNIPSNNNITPSPSPSNQTRGTFNSILSIGAGYALRGSGLHCPICRVLGSMH